MKESKDDPPFPHDQPTDSATPDTQLRKQPPHALVERRYRHGLNRQIEALRQRIPSLSTEAPRGDSAETDDAASSAQQVPTKAVVLSQARQYIQQLEAERGDLQRQNESMKQLLHHIQRTGRCSQHCSDGNEGLNYQSNLPRSMNAAGDEGET
jgi:hypothetical protein